MTEFLFGVLIFASGMFCGVIVAAFFIVGARSEDEFDGGWQASNSPPVRTKIWHGSIDEG